jgi:hypothetical protein
MYDVYVYRIELPGNIHEMVVPDSEDDGWTVYIDKNLSDQKYRESYDHAMKHILGKHFEMHDVQDIEYEAHRAN